MRDHPEPSAVDDEKALRPPTFAYGQIEAALAAATGLDTADVRNRVRHLRRVGVPKLPKTGSGNAVTYTLYQALELLIGVRLTMIGTAPRLIQPLAQYATFAHDCRAEEAKPEIAIIAPVGSPFSHVDFDYGKAARPQPQNGCNGDPNRDLIICLLPAVDLLEGSWPAETLLTSLRDFSTHRPSPRAASLLPYLVGMARRYQAVGVLHFHGEARLAQFVTERWLPDCYAVLNVSAAARKLCAALPAGPPA
jgi:hypothetical protein